MSELLDVLYQYIVEEKLYDHLDRELYDQDRQYGLYHYEALRATLDPAQAAHLDGFVDARTEQDNLEAGAIFRAALSMGLELGRL